MMISYWTSFFRDDTVAHSSHSMNRVEHIYPSIYIRNIIHFFTFKDIDKLRPPPPAGLRVSLLLYILSSIPIIVIVEHLMEAKTSFHTFRFYSAHTFRIVIRNLHQSTPGAVLSAALSKKHLVEQVYYVKKFTKLLPSFISLRQMWRHS
jgi:hypothetical protein